MSTMLADAPLNERVAKIYDLSIKSYRQMITKQLKQTILDTLKEVDASATVDSDGDLKELFEVVERVFGEYIKKNNIPEQLFHS